MGAFARPMMHPEVLPPEQQACLRQLGPAATAEGFHLIGGTAVAIHLGHRQSVDFDWCTQQFPGEPVNLTASLADRGVRLTLTSLAHGTVHGSVDGVKVSFLEIKPPLLEPALEWPEYGCRLASPCAILTTPTWSRCRRCSCLPTGRRSSTPSAVRCGRSPEPFDE